MVRLPEWAKTYKVSVNGAKVSEQNGYVIVSKTWQEEDIVTIKIR